jgi:2-polyprenyl-6-methoxyphenol hydroxylase-like FAD-dependent oxidoreductase
MARVFVTGGGPSGSVFACRMAELGHDVTLAEQQMFPRRQLGESLSPGVLRLLDTIGLRRAVEAAGFLPVRSVLVQWEGPARVREDPKEEGLLVDRGAFDRLLLDHARARGVRVLQPCRLVRADADEEGWSLKLDSDGRMEMERADFLCHAGGRTGGDKAGRRMTGCRTVALYAYWQGRLLPSRPRIEAGQDAWHWGVPLPGGLYNTLVFTGPAELRRMGRATLEERFTRLVAGSGLMEGCVDARKVAPVAAIDATPYLDEVCVTLNSIRIGDAALALDPVSSSGVQRAIQGAMAAAVTANTLLRKPEHSAVAIDFYRTSLREASQRHGRWAAQYHGQVAQVRGGRFWRERAAPADIDPPQAIRQTDAVSLRTRRVGHSPELEFSAAPCIEGDFVSRKTAIRHPGLEGPVIFLAGRDLPALLSDVPAGMTPLEIAHSWSDRVPLQTGLQILVWLLDNGVLVDAANEAAA